MIVICKKGNSRLIKGHQYKVDAIFNDGTSTRYLEAKIRIENIDYLYTVNNFVDINGNPLPKSKFDNSVLIELTKGSDLNIGDILICKSDKYKTLLQNSMYKIEDIKITTTLGWKNTPYDTYFIKFIGISRRIKFNPYSFRRTTIAEDRELKLGSIFGEDDNITKTDFKDGRKLDYILDKDDYLLKTLAKSIMDPNRHGISIIEWACQVVSRKVDITPNDYKDHLKMTLKDILDNIK